MSDIKFDGDFEEHELVHPTGHQGENLDTQEAVDREDVNLKDPSLIDPSLDEIEEMEDPDARRSRFEHRTKEEALKQYMQDGLDRRNTKGHN